MNPHKRCNGFSLIELLLVMAIIAMLVVMLSPAMAFIRTRADTTACANNLRQIGVAVQLYVTDNDNRYPKIETDPKKTRFMRMRRGSRECWRRSENMG